MSGKNKDWSVEDDIYVIEQVMLKYKTQDYNLLLKNIASDIGTTQSSVKMRIQNFMYLLTGEGLEHYAPASKEAIKLSLKKYSKSQLIIALS